MRLPNLKGRRVKLIGLGMSGLKDMYEYSSKPEFYRFLEFPPQKTIQETKVYLKHLMARSNVDNAHYWFIKHKKDNKIIGSIGIHNIDWRKAIGEVSYGISPAYWGKKYFQEALRLVLEHVFKKMGFHRVCATTCAKNHASVEGLKRMGFKIEGRLREYYLDYRGNRYDATILGLLKNDYR